MIVMHSVDHSTVFLRNYASVASLAVLFWEYLVLFPTELQYIWGSPTNVLKGIYVVARYAGLTLQMINFGLVISPLSETPVEGDLCRKWVTFLVAGVTMLFCCLEAVAMLRVYFLYNRTGSAGCILSLMFAVQLGLGILSCYQNFSRSRFDISCNMLGTYGHESFYFGGTIVFINITMWCMTVFKKRAGAGEQRLISMLVHQGAYIMVLVFAIVLSGVPTAFVSDQLRPALIFLWPQALFSICTCRLILSMYRLSSNPNTQETHVEGRGTVTADPRLSSMFELGANVREAASIQGAG